MKIRFIAKWSKQNQLGVPKGIPALIPHDAYKKRLGEFLLEAEAKEKAEELQVEIKTLSKNRTLDQNALMWSLYQIEANEQNAGHQFGNVVKPESLYEADLKANAPQAVIYTDAESAEYIRSEYRVVKQEQVENGVKLAIMLSTSFFTTKQMAEWIDMIFNRLAENGVAVTNPGEIQLYWNEWRRSLDAQKISLHSDAQTEKEYKERNPICEATGQYIGTGGSLAHIRARGMGGKAEVWKDNPENWLHLCDEAHAEFDNGKGMAEFVEKYPHLKAKIEAAYQHKEQEIVEEELDIF